MASAGSRTVTAGSEFHRPRSTLNNANQYAMSGYSAPIWPGSGCHAAPPGKRVYRHSAEQDCRGPDVLRSRTKPEKLQAVVDHGDHQPAEYRAEHPAAAAKEAHPTDDGGRHGVQNVLAALEVAGHAAQVGGVDDAADAGGQTAQHERGDPDPAQVDAGPPGCLCIAADGVDVPAEPGPVQQNGPDHEQ